jgi:inosose dehydratase
MRETGLVATEFGPSGFLPDDPVARAALLGSYGLAPVGGFVPAVLHDPRHDPVREVERALAGFGAAGMVVLAAATGRDGYDERPLLGEPEWSTLLDNLERVAAHVAGTGRTTSLHPHVGTVVERRDEVERVLSGSTIPLCLDTGHLLIGGTDPVELARLHSARVGHVHLKDVDAELARQVRSGATTYTEAVRQGVYRPLGAGDIDIAALVAALEGAGYDGWYVMEQDTILPVAPAAGAGPIDDVRAGLAFLRRAVA